MSRLLIAGLLLAGTAVAMVPIDDALRRQQADDRRAVAEAEARAALRYCRGEFSNHRDRAACLASFGIPSGAVADDLPDEDER
jgi:hypothetical protein